MADIADRNDPFYSSQEGTNAGWVWDGDVWVNRQQDRDNFAKAHGLQPKAAPPAQPAPSGTDVSGDYKPINPVGDQASGYAIDPSVGKIDNSWESEAKKLLGEVMGRPDVGLNTVQADATRMFQQGLLQQLQGQATGTGPSLADAQLRKASDQNLANTLSSIQATRGMGATAAAANAAGAGAQAGQQLAQDSAIVKLQEQMQAQGLLGQLATGTRGQDIGQAAQAAEIEIKKRAQRDQIAAQLIGQGMSAAQAQTQADIQVAGMNQQGQITADQLKQARQIFEKQLALMEKQFNRKMDKEEAEAIWKGALEVVKMLANAAGGATGAGNITG